MKGLALVFIFWAAPAYAFDWKCESSHLFFTRGTGVSWRKMPAGAAHLDGRKILELAAGSGEKELWATVLLGTPAQITMGKKSLYRTYEPRRVVEANGSFELEFKNKRYAATVFLRCVHIPGLLDR